MSDDAMRGIAQTAADTVLNRTSEIARELGIARKDESFWDALLRLHDENRDLRAKVASLEAYADDKCGWPDCGCDHDAICLERTNAVIREGRAALQAARGGQ